MKPVGCGHYGVAPKPWSVPLTSVYKPTELAASVDPIGIGAYGARDVDRGEGPFVQQKAMLRAADIDVEAHSTHFLTLLAAHLPMKRGGGGNRTRE